MLVGGNGGAVARTGKTLTQHTEGSRAFDEKWWVSLQTTAQRRQGHQKLTQLEPQQLPKQTTAHRTKPAPAPAAPAAAMAAKKKQIQEVLKTQAEFDDFLKHEGLKGVC